jgi:hypothetical protein
MGEFLSKTVIELSILGRQHTLHWSINVRDCPKFGPAKTVHNGFVVCPGFQNSKWFVQLPKVQTIVDHAAQGYHEANDSLSVSRSTMNA